MTFTAAAVEIRISATRHISTARSARATLSAAMHHKPSLFKWNYHPRTGAVVIDEESFTRWLAQPVKIGRPRNIVKEQTK